MNPPPAKLSALLGDAVRVGTVRLGEVSGVLVDATQSTVLGLEVSSLGGARRFLPWVAARLAPGGTVSVESALFLVDDGASYERRGARPLRDPLELAGLAAVADGTIARLEPVSERVATGSTR